MAIKKSKSGMKKVVTKKVIIKKPSREHSPVKTVSTKSHMLSEIARMTLLTKKQVASVIEEFNHLILRHLKKGGPGLFNMPGVLKILTIKKSAVPARKGINPFTGQETVFKAKPARTVVKIRALKGLKDMV